MIGLNLRKANIQLERFGLKRGRVSNIESQDTQKIGLIAKQRPSPGSRVEYDTPVDLWLWTKTPQLVTLPNLIGRSSKEAKKILAVSGLRVGKISTLKNDGRHKPGSIQRQSPKRGSKVAPNSSVNLWIWDSSKPAEVIVE